MRIFYASVESSKSNSVKLSGGGGHVGRGGGIAEAWMEGGGGGAYKLGGRGEGVGRGGGDLKCGGGGGAEIGRAFV